MNRFLFPVIWMGLIFTLSTDIGAMHNTSRFLVPLIRFIYPTIPETDLRMTLIVVRKSAHFFEYAVLSILWLTAFMKGGKKVSEHPAAMALLVSIGYACLDELHHTFVISRTGSITDIGIDAIGAIVGLSVWQKGKMVSHSSSVKIKAKYFGWWFSWGVFSSIMLLTVSEGGTLAFWQMLLVILGVGIAAGLGGLFYYARQN